MLLLFTRHDLAITMTRICPPFYCQGGFSVSSIFLYAYDYVIAQINSSYPPTTNGEMCQWQQDHEAYLTVDNKIKIKK